MGTLPPSVQNTPVASEPTASNAIRIDSGVWRSHDTRPTIRWRTRASLNASRPTSVTPTSAWSHTSHAPSGVPTVNDTSPEPTSKATQPPISQSTTAGGGATCTSLSSRDTVRVWSPNGFTVRS